jgi:hypothetical protein
MKFDFCIQNVLGRCRHGSKCRYKHLDVCKSFFDYKQCTKSHCGKYHFYSQNALDYSKQRFTRLCADYQTNTCTTTPCPHGCRHEIACSHFIQNGFCNNPSCTLTHTPLNKEIDQVCRTFTEFGECNRFKCRYGVHTRNIHDETKVFPYERICPCDSRKCRKKIHQSQCRNYKTNKYCNTKDCKYVHCEYITAESKPQSAIWGNYNYTYPNEDDNYPPPIIVSTRRFEEYNPANPSYNSSSHTPDSPKYNPSSPTQYNPASPSYEPRIPPTQPKSPTYQPSSPIPASPSYEPTKSPIIHPPTPPSFPISPSSPTNTNKRSHHEISIDEDYEAIKFLTNFAQTHCNL